MALKTPKQANNTQLTRRNNPPWEDLPQELLTTISNIFPSNSIDILAFRSVCKSWYSSSQPISPVTLSTILPMTSPYPAYSFDQRFLAQDLGTPIVSVTAIFAIRKRSNDVITYIMFADQLTPAKFIIRQPFSNYSYAMPANFPAYIDVPNVHVTEIGRFYNLSFHSEINKPPSIWCEYVQKVVMNSDEKKAVALFNTGQLGLSSFVNPNWVASDWGPLYTCSYDAVDYRIDDVVYYEGKVLAVDRLCRLYHLISEWNHVDVALLISGCGMRRKRLVESNGWLYLVVCEGVCEESGERMKFKVYRHDEDVNEWVEVSSVGGMVLFFGLDFLFSVSSQELGGLFGDDCVVFREGSFRYYEGVGGGGGDGDGDEGEDDDTDGRDGDSEGDDDNDDEDEDEDDDDNDDDDGDGSESPDDVIFNNVKRWEFPIGLWHMEKPSHYGIIGSYPGCPELLWPPPSWLWSVDISKRLVDLEAALNDLLLNAPAPAEKTTDKEVKELAPSAPAEQVIVNDNQQDNSEIWSQAHSIKDCLYHVKACHNFRSFLTNFMSRQNACQPAVNLQNQAGSSSRGIEKEHFETSNVHCHILQLEEITSGLQKRLISSTTSC